VKDVNSVLTLKVMNRKLVQL